MFIFDLFDINIQILTNMKNCVQSHTFATTCTSQRGLSWTISMLYVIYQ